MRLGFGDGFGGCCDVGGGVWRVGVFGGAKAAHALRWGGGGFRVVVVYLFKKIGVA